MRSRLALAVACALVIGLSVFSLDQLVGGYLPFSLVYSLVWTAVAVPVAYVWLGRVDRGETLSKGADTALAGLLVALLIFAVALGSGATATVALGYGLIAGVVVAMIRYLLRGRRERRRR